MSETIDRRLNFRKCMKCEEGTVIPHLTWLICANPACGEGAPALTKRFSFFGPASHAAVDPLVIMNPLVVELERRRGTVEDHEGTFWFWGDPAEERRVDKEAEDLEQAKVKAHFGETWRIFLERLQEAATRSGATRAREEGL